MNQAEEAAPPALFGLDAHVRPSLPRPADVLNKLRQKHAAADGSGANFGIDVNTGEGGPHPPGGHLQPDRQPAMRPCRGPRAATTSAPGWATCPLLPGPHAPCNPCSSLHLPRPAAHGTGGVVDTYAAFVWEPALVKINAITAAAEAASLVLSVDETVRNPRSEGADGGMGPPMGGRGMGGRGMGGRGRGRGMRR